MGTEDGKSKDEDDRFDRRLLIKNLLTQRGTEEENRRFVRSKNKNVLAIAPKAKTAPHLGGMRAIREFWDLVELWKLQNSFREAGE